ncbi:hypothetical protein R3P38DRAFT_2879003, partial [Favolaschia claudopus]
MALQTEPRSAPTSSPTSDAASEPSASPTPSPNPTDAGGFTLTASPPLILAFLAVGMFAISMIVFFGWRRIAAARTPWVPPSEAVSIGERPKIWDVWMSCEQSQEISRAEWRNIQSQPLSATIWDHAPPVLPPDNPPPPRHQSLAMEAFTHLRQRYRERHRRQEDAMLEAKSSSSESLLRLQLQVAVTIAMPTPDFVGTSSRPENTDDDEQL